MPAYHVERSTRIDASADKVRPAIANFSEWPKWSPWLCMERTATLNVQGTPGKVGHGYNWDGKLVGAGEMQITSVDDTCQRMDLSFLRPFKSHAKVMMEIRPVSDSETEVTWHMDGKMPFFMFFMIGPMKTFIGMDYERGLNMLKEYVETGSVKSETEIVGIVDVPAKHYLGIEAECSMEEIGKSMGETMPAAHKSATDNHLEISGPPGALYNHVDLKQKRCRYTAIVQTATEPQVTGAACGTISPCRALKVVHRGSYHHLGNAWSAAMAYRRTNRVKPLKTQCDFELYTNDPAETPEEELVTELYLPVRT